MTQLSPQAQAVLNAANNAQSYHPDDCLNESRAVAAAALRVVADQVQMNTPLGDTDADAGVFAAHHAIRAHFLAIAAELEALPE
jgi:hypothetical protein